MALITILIGLMVERLLGSLEEWRRFDWFLQLTRRVRERMPKGKLWQGALEVVAILALPAIGVVLVWAWLGSLWSFLGFLFALAVLLYSFGPRDLEAEVEAFLDAHERGDEESASWHAAELLGDELPQSQPQLVRRMIERIFIAANERFFAVIFWFVILGPMGAVIYRLAWVLRGEYEQEEGEFAEAVLRLNSILDWVPARLCGLSYAVAGSFVDATQAWRQEAAKWPDVNRGVVANAGFGALRYDPAEYEQGIEPEAETRLLRSTMALVRRAALVALSVLALLTLGGWAG